MTKSPVINEPRYDDFGNEITVGNLFYYANYYHDIILGVVVGFTPTFVRYKHVDIEENFDKKEILVVSEMQYKISNSKLVIIPESAEKWELGNEILRLRDRI